VCLFAVAAVLLLLGVQVALLASGEFAPKPAQRWQTGSLLAAPPRCSLALECRRNAKRRPSRFGGQSVVVSADEVEVVGVRKVKLPPGCKKVEVVEIRGASGILLDGSVVD